MSNQYLQKQTQVELQGEMVRIVENGQILNKGKKCKKQISDVKRRWCPFFMNCFAKYLKKEENRQRKLLLQIMEQVKGEKKKKYEQKVLKQLINNKNSHFKAIWLEFLDSSFVQESIKSNNKIKKENVDTKQEYLKLIPEIKRETLSEFPFTNFLAATYIYEVNSEIKTTKLGEKNNHNEQGKTNIDNQFIDDKNFDDEFI